MVLRRVGPTERKARALCIEQGFDPDQWVTFEVTFSDGQKGKTQGYRWTYFIPGISIYFKHPT